MDKGRIAAASLTMALMAGATPMSAGAVTTNLIDSVEITADTNITVAANEVLKIEYLWATSPHVVTKSGMGTLVLAAVGGELSIDVAEGTLASARPASIPSGEAFAPSFRLDASDTSKFTFAPANGTNFVSKVMDADGGENYGSTWGGYGKPYVADETLNGLGLLDFGTFYNSKTYLTGGHKGMYGMHASVPLGDFFYVWKDRDDAIDSELNNGAEFIGPCVIGNNGDWFPRGYGGGGNGFPLYALGSAGSIKKNMRLDCADVPVTKASSYRVPRGFHVFRNRLNAEDTAMSMSCIGWCSPYGGGFLLAELVVYSNRLSGDDAARVESQLASKWLGAPIKSLTLRNGASLDVSAVKFRIGTFTVEGTASLIGQDNLAYDASASSPTSTLAIASGAWTLPAAKFGTVPSASFPQSAAIVVDDGTNTIESVASGVGELVKSGEGVLRVAFPSSGVTSLKVEAGTLSVSALHELTSEYHVDAADGASIDTNLSDGKALVSEWRDLNNPARTLKPTTSRKYNFATTTLVRAPYLVAEAANGLPMVDFGTFADANHPDGWGAELVPSKTYGSGNGLHEMYVVWKDDPAVKNYPYAVEGTKFTGPCLFGAEYYWYRSTGGNGESFHMLHSTVAGRMYGGVHRIDGVDRSMTAYRVPEGLHVLVQQMTATGAPFEEMGANYQAPVTTSSGRVDGVFGGLAMGEVLMFKYMLPDLKRDAIESELMAKWKSVANVVEYENIEVAPGAEFAHRYADLVTTELVLGGRLSAKSIKPHRFTIAANGAEIDGTLELAEEGELVVTSSGPGEFNTLSASSVFMSGRGTLSFSTVPPPQLIGREVKLIASENIKALVYKWSVPSLLPNGMKVNLVVRNDGLYLVFRGGGFSVVIR